MNYGRVLGSQGTCWPTDRDNDDRLRTSAGVLAQPHHVMAVVQSENGTVDRPTRGLQRLPYNRVSEANKAYS